MISSDILLKKTFQTVRDILQDAPGCHDFDHTLRVYENAEKIALAELAPDDHRGRLTVRLAVLLHDAARPEEMESGGKVCHAALGRIKSAEILRSLGCEDEPLIEAVSECVARHRFRASAVPRTLEEKIVYDADKLDSIGAVGIGRSFHFAGRIGARLHNMPEEALNGAAYGREDTALREYLVKLRYVPERMLTAEGRRLAQPRKVFMDEFFKRLDNETAHSE